MNLSEMSNELNQAQHDMLTRYVTEIFNRLSNVTIAQFLDALATHAHQHGVDNEVVKAIECAARTAHDTQV